jgi:hypothetical protein
MDSLIRKLPTLLLASLLGCLALTACDRHPAQTTSSSHANVNAVAVRPEAARSQGIERATGMTEESDESSEVPTGFSPLATAVAANTPAVAAPIPSKWIEGKNYTSLSPAQPTGAPPDKVEVVEVFNQRSGCDAPRYVLLLYDSQTVEASLSLGAHSALRFGFSHLYVDELYQEYFVLSTCPLVTTTQLCFLFSTAACVCVRLFNHSHSSSSSLARLRSS